VLLAYQAYLDRSATQALMTGRCQRDRDFPSFEILTGRKTAPSAGAMSETMMAHNFRLWQHKLGQAGGTQSEGE
jgi:hypothetical protein